MRKRVKMRIEQNLLRRNLHHTNGNQHHNGNGLYNGSNHNNNNTNATPTNNKRNQAKEVGQDIPVRKSALQETESNGEPGFLNPELQRELNRILAEADGDVKLNHDSEDSSPSASSSSSISSASSEEDDDYEHPRRLFLEEIAEEDEDEEEQEDNDSDEEEDENVDEDDENLVINFKEKPVMLDDNKGELDEPCSDIASDSDATITNEHCTGEEIERDHGELKTKTLRRRSSSHVTEIDAEMLNKEHDEKILKEWNSSKKRVEIVLHKAEDDDSKSAVENEWGNEQIDETPKETSAEHARGETGISTETDYQEPVESEQQQQLQYQQQPHSFNQEKYSEEALRYEHSGAEPKSKHELYNGCAAADVYNVSEVSQQPLKFLHQQQQQKKKQHEHPKEPSDQPVLKENTNSVGTVSYSGACCNTAAEKVDEEENEEVDNNDDDDDDDGESSCTGSTSSGGSSGSSIGTLEELEEQAQKQHGHVEIRLFHDVGSNSGSCTNTGERTTKYISREWGSRESKCRAVLVDLQTSTSSEVHDLVPESLGESGTGSSSFPISSSPLPPTSPSFPLKSSFLSSTPISSSYLLAGKQGRGEDVSVCDSCTNNTSPRPTIIKNNKITTNSSAAVVAATAKISYSSTTSYPHSTPVISTASSKSPSILITSPKPSPTTEVERVLSSSLSSALTTVAANPPKLKKVSWQNHVESKTYNTSDEPSSVALSASNFNKDEKEYSDDDDEENSEALTNSPENSAGLTQEQHRQELKSSFSASAYSSDSGNFYNNSQFSTADFWASRNGVVDINEHQQRQQYLQSLYYSESENSPSSTTSTATEETYPHNQQSSASSSSNNHRYYYPSEYFKGSLNEPIAQNNSSEDSETSTNSVSVNSNSIWKEIKYFPDRAKEQQPADNIYSTRTTTTSSAGPPTSLQTSPTRPTSVLDNNRNAEMHQRLSGGEQRLRSVLRKPGVGGVKKRSVTFNESLNLFYEAECSCWIHEDDYHRLRQAEQQEAQQHHHQHHQHHQQFIYEQTHPHYPHTHTHQNFIYEPPPIEFEDPPTLSPPEGYKDRFFPQEDPSDPDVTRVGPPSPPSARRKVFLKENSTDQIPPPPPPTTKTVILNGLEDEEEDEESKKSSGASSNSSGKGSRLGGILKGGRLWRSNSAEGKKVTSPPEEPDVVKCTERENRERLAEKESNDRTNTISSGPSSPQNQVQTQESQSSYQSMPTKVSTGTAPLRTSEQIRLAVDSTLRLRTKKTKPECSLLVEKLRWLTSLDDDDPSDSSSQSGFATWPSRDKNGQLTTTTSSKKSDAGTSTNEEFVNSAGIRQPPPIYSSSEAKIKQISYTLEDIDEGLKGSEIELESFITEDGGRIERLKKRYSGEEPGDDYGFSRRPSVKGIKPKFSSTNQIFAQYTAMRASGTETPVPVESQYENTRGLPPPVSFDQQIPNHLEGARMQLNYEVQSATGRPPEESRAHFEMIRQSFEHASFSNFNRPHSWSVSTLPHPHHTHAHSNSISLGSTASPIPQNSGGMPPNLLSNNFGSTLSVSQPMQQSQNNLSMTPSPINANNAQGAVRADTVQMMGGNPATIYGTLPSQSHMAAQQNQVAQPGQPIYGTVRRVPNVIGRPLFLHYGALSVEAHPNKIVQPFPRPTKVPETPSPTQQPPPLRYYGPPIRYYNSPPPVPPRSVTTTVSGGPGGPGNGVPTSALNNSAITDCQQERGVPEGATDEEPSLKESYSMNV